MKILFANSSSGSRGGGETFLIYLGQGLAARGHEVMLWTSAHPRMDEMAARFAAFGAVQRAEYVNTYDRPGRSLAALMDRGAAARAAREWANAKPDIIHINKQNLEDALDLLRATNQVDSPSVATIHITQSAAFLRAKGARLRDWVSRRGLNSFRGPMVAVSEPRRLDLERFLGHDSRVVCIPNGVPIPPLPDTNGRIAIRASLGILPDEIGIFAVGRMMPQKRPLLFLEIAARILARAPNARFFWIGDGPLASEWDARARALDLSARVQRLGWREDVSTLLGAGDLLLHTAEFEGLPLAILEAMAAGVPCAVIETLHREMPFLDESNSVCVSDDESLLKILQERDELTRRACAARNLVAARFSTEVMAAAYENLYRQQIE